MTVQGVAVAWPRKEDYARFCEVCEDAMQETHEAFVAAKEPALDALVAKGVKVKKVSVDPDEMARWCAANGEKVNSEGRSAFAAVQASQGKGAVHKRK